MALKVFVLGTTERSWLQTMADLLNKAQREIEYTVEECYFDFGQNWMYTTIIAKRNIDGQRWQALNPREQEMVVGGDFAEFAEVFAERSKRK